MPRKPYPPHIKRAHNLKTRYGINPEEVEAMLAKQNGLCPLCGKPPKRVCVDHDHATGRVRGILCHGCNVGLGQLEAIGVDRAVAYLRSA